MNRSVHTALIGSMFLASALSVEAQQTGLPKRVAFVHVGFAALTAPFADELREGLRERGWIEGKNVIVEAHYAEGKLERVAEFAAELVRRPVDVLVTGGVPPALVLKKATQTIPIVAVVTDPVGTGVVAPGGNVAAFDILPSDAAVMQLNVLRELVPGLSRVALVWNGSNPASQLNARRVREAAQTAGIDVIDSEVSDPGQLDVTVPALRGKGAQAIFFVADPRANKKRVGELTTGTGLPTICQERDNADAGCLVAYGPSLRAMYRQTASYVDQILRGTPPASLPVGAPTRFELVINAASAKAMGLTVPPSVLNRADAVVQ